MTEFLLVRNPEAHHGGVGPFEASYGLTERGEGQARNVGRYLRVLQSRPTSFERGASQRARVASRLMMGSSGLTRPYITEQPAFRHSGLSTAQVAEGMHEWLLRPRANEEMIVACMSRRAVASLLGVYFDWTNEEIDEDVQTGPAVIRTGSVTSVSVVDGEMTVKYYDRLPKHRVRRRSYHDDRHA